MNKALPLFACAVATSVGLAAIPQIDPGDVTMSQDQSNGRVSVKYTLKNASAVVTLDFETNYVDGAETKWASIGGENIQRLKGPVNKVVRDLNKELTITWRPDRDWPGKKLETGGIRAVVKAWALEAPPPYMIVDLTVKSNVTYYASEEFVPGRVTDTVYKTDKMVMRLCPAANVRWRMGSAPKEYEQLSDSYKPWYQIGQAGVYVTLSNDYYIGIYELTQGQMYNITKRKGNLNTDKPDSDVRPAAEMCWNEYRATTFQDSTNNRWPEHEHTVAETSILGNFRAFTGVEFDLPTEAQWEFACRAGCGAEFCNGATFNYSDIWDLINGNDKIKEVAVMHTEFSESQPVGSKNANDWGIFDMHGNVSELTLDACSTGNHDRSQDDPEIGELCLTPDCYCVIKGASCYDTVAWYYRSAYRGTWVKRSGAGAYAGARFAAPAAAH